MGTENVKRRRSFRWSKEARDLVKTNLNPTGPEFRELVSKLAAESGNPRDACLRFARQLGVKRKRPYRHWTAKEQQELEHWLTLHPVRLVALKLRRPSTAVYGMIRRLGLNGRLSKEGGLSLYGLARALQTRPATVRKWIAAGLECHNEGTEKLPRLIISPDSFARFVNENPKLVQGNRITKDRLNVFIQRIFPPSHMELLPVRGSKKERLAYQTQMFSDEDDWEGEDPGAAGSASKVH